MAASIADASYLEEDRVHSAFLLFDKDKKGRISKEDVKNVLGGL